MRGVDPVWLVDSYHYFGFFFQVCKSAIYLYDGVELDKTQRDHETLSTQNSLAAAKENFTAS